MAGIVFLRTENLEKITDFYINVIGMKKWLEQPGVMILQHDNFLLGFHEQSAIDKDSLITFFYKTKEEVHHMYATLGVSSIKAPSDNEKYRTFNFFAKDPEGRIIEFQTFLHELPPY